MSAHSPEELDQLFGEALNAGDLDALVALYEPQAVFVSEPGQTLTGTAAIREVLSAFVSMKPKITMDPRDTHTLPLPTGELGRSLVRERAGRERHQLEKLERSLPSPILGPAGKPGHEADVVFDGEVREKADFLNHVAGLSPQLDRIPGVRLEDMTPRLDRRTQRLEIRPQHPQGLVVLLDEEHPPRSPGQGLDSARAGPGKEVPNLLALDLFGEDLEHLRRREFRAVANVVGREQAHAAKEVGR